MNKLLPTLLSCTIAAVSQGVLAGSDVYFTPLTQSAAVASPNHVNELNSPWQAPAGISQTNLTSVSKIEADITRQSTVRASGLGSSASMWDMVAYDETGKFIFIPHETMYGAGVTRYDIENDQAEVLFHGDEGGLNSNWANDWGAFDPSLWTPHQTLFLAEEWSGEGRVMEVLNPMDSPNSIQVRELTNIPNVSHEGLRFSKNGKTLYFIDEDNSGSIYKIVFSNANDYTKGQVFVLSVDNFTGNPAARYDDASNSDAARTGSATWVALTDANGNALTEQDPFSNEGGSGARAGRLAADELNATPYGRPEDIEVGTLANGNEVLYFTATSEAAVYSVEMQRRNKAMVRVFLSDAETPKNAGFAPTTAVINSPDNLAQDALGNIYVIEDSPNSSDVGGDIWFAKDLDNDGVAESVYHFLSLQADGSESTGMIFNPAKPTEFVVSVQHPDSTDIAEVENGFGDALWKFDIADVVPPTCEKGEQQGRVRTCTINTARFVEALEKAAERAKHK